MWRWFDERWYDVSFCMGCLQRMSLFLLLVVVSLGWMSCGERIIYKDYPVEFDQKKGDLIGTGEVFLKLGFFKEQLFRELQENGDVHIIQGFQGGTWVHLSIRVSGVSSRGRIEASLSGLGKISYDLKLVRSAEGFFEAYDIPIPIRKTEAQLRAIYGKGAVLKVTYTTDKKKLSAEKKVILREG